MRVSNRRTNLQHQLQTFANFEFLRIAIARDRLAFDIFEREVRRAVGSHAAVVQLGDMRMHQTREKIPLAQEPCTRLGADEIGAHQLQRHALGEIAFFALGQIDAAHAAFADQAQQAISADAMPDQIDRRSIAVQALEHADGAVIENAGRSALRRQQATDFAEQIGVIGTLLGQPRCTLRFRLLLALPEQFLDPQPARVLVHVLCPRSIA